MWMRCPRVTPTGVPGSWTWAGGGGAGCPALPTWPGCEQRPCPPLWPRLSALSPSCTHTPSAPAAHSCSELPPRSPLRASVQAVPSALKAFPPLLYLSFSHSPIKTKAGVTSSRKPSLMSPCPKLCWPPTAPLGPLPQQLPCCIIMVFSQRLCMCVIFKSRFK